MPGGVLSLSASAGMGASGLGLHLDSTPTR